MKKILLTCFGSNIAYEIVQDFLRRDVELFISDMNLASKAQFLTERFLTTHGASDPAYVHELLQKAKDNGIDMIIPGGDEEAFVLMREQGRFRREGIEVAVQEAKMLGILSSKSAQYDYLKTKGFPVPFYGVFRTVEELEKILAATDYPRTPFLVKPNTARGGRGIVLLSERPVANKDNLALMNRSLLEQSLKGGSTEYMLMEYIDGIVYDVDALCYANGEVYFGLRKRFNNVTKLFSGNTFENNNDALKTLARRLYGLIPTKYLIDYDFMVTEDGRVVLLEINPRPSGSTVSYIPYGINLYYILAKSYLENQHIPVPDSLSGRQAHVFYKMVSGGTP